MTKRVPDNYYSQSMRFTPTAYYRLGELTGTVAYDGSGNAYDGTLNGTVGEGIPGAIIGDPNAAMSFDGSTAYITLPSGLNLGSLTVVTIACWVYLPSSSAGQAYRAIANSHTDTDNHGFQLAIGSLGGFSNFGFGISNVQVSFSGITWNVGKWFHVVITYDSSFIRNYVNGVLNASGAASGAIVSVGLPINIGRNPIYNGDYLKGNVDEVAFYFNKALTSDQIKALYLGGRGGQILYQR